MTFLDDAGLTLEALAAYAAGARAGEGRVIAQPPMAELARRLDLARLIADGGLTAERLARFLDLYLGASTRLQHPRYMAHQVAVPAEHGALAALIDGFTNNAMAIYEMGPAAATVEAVVLGWMLGKIGWRAAPLPGADTASNAGRDETAFAGGVLTHGGSLANLTALLAARARLAPDAWEHGTPRDLVVVATEASHYSISRAVAVLGLGARAVRNAPTDALGRLDAARLPAFLDALAREGKRPMAVVASACSTALGLYDPLSAIAAVCAARDVWLHVDGAHGASALVSPRLRRRLAGIEAAHSVIWDAHKMLRAPVISAAVMVRASSFLDAAFREEASYLFHDKDQPGIDFIHRTLECTKAALGLKVFFAIAGMGEAALAAGIERQTDLATEAAALIRARPDFEVAAEPETNIVCFRLDGPDALQLELRRRLTEDGRFYISSTEALGRRWLRLALMNPATTLTDIGALLTELQRLAGEM